MMRETIEQRGGHLCIPEHGRPLAERQVGGDDDRCPLVEPADEMDTGSRHLLPADLDPAQGHSHLVEMRTQRPAKVSREGPAGGSEHA